MKSQLLILGSFSLAGGLSVPASAQDFEANAHAQGVIENIVDGLIGNRYNVSQRQAVRTCAWSAVRRAERDYRRYFTGPPRAYPGYRGNVRVTAITDVQRRALVTRVRGLLDTSRYGYRGGRNGADVSFRCDVSRRGSVTDLRLERNPWFQPR
jgi:hypothetical protein